MVAICEGGIEEERVPSARLGRHSSLPLSHQLHQQVLEIGKPIFKHPPQPASSTAGPHSKFSC